MALNVFVFIPFALISIGLGIFHGELAFIANSSAGLKFQLIQASFMLLPLCVTLVLTTLQVMRRNRPDNMQWILLIILVWGSYQEYKTGFNLGGAIVVFFNFGVTIVLALRSGYAFKKTI